MISVTVHRFGAIRRFLLVGFFAHRAGDQHSLPSPRPDVWHLDDDR